MFFEQLKRQYCYWCFLTGGLLISRIIDNAISLEILRLFVNMFMVLAGAFIFYSVAYPFGAIFRHLRDRKSISVLFLLLAYATVFFMAPVQEADAGQQHKEAIKKGALVVVGWIAGTSFENKASDLVEAVEDAITDAVHGTIEDIWDFIVSDNTPYCSACSAGCSSCPSYGNYDGYSGAY